MGDETSERRQVVKRKRAQSTGDAAASAAPSTGDAAASAAPSTGDAAAATSVAVAADSPQQPAASTAAAPSTEDMPSTGDAATSVAVAADPPQRPVASTAAAPGTGDIPSTEGAPSTEDTSRTGKYTILKVLATTYFGFILLIRTKDRLFVVKKSLLSNIEKFNKVHAEIITQGGNWLECRKESPVDEVAVMQDIPIHPNVVGYKGWDSTQNSLYLFTEFMERGDLDKILATVDIQDIRKEVLWHWCRGLASALEHIHTNGIMHGDVSPCNCLISTDDELKLGDFGAARKDGEKGHGKESVSGKKFFVAPEVLEIFRGGARYSGFPTDNWSCAVVYFTIFTGGKKNLYEMPDKNSNNDFKIMVDVGISEYIRRGQASGYRNWDKIDNTVCDLLSKILVIDPRARYTATEIVEHIDKNCGSVSLLKK